MLDVSNMQQEFGSHCVANTLHRTGCSSNKAYNPTLEALGLNPNRAPADVFHGFSHFFQTDVGITVAYVEVVTFQILFN